MSEAPNNPNGNNNNSNNNPNRRRRRPNNRPAGQGQGPGPNNNPRPPQGERQAQGPNSRPPQGQNNNPNRNQGPRNDGPSRNRRPHGRVLTINQVLVKYDNLLEQHLITRKKYYEYFNRVDERQLYRLEKNFYDSIEHLRAFEEKLEPWQREALEDRKTERYRPDFTYSENRGIDINEKAPVEVSPDEIEDPHFKDTQKEASMEYRDDTEESEGSFEDYLKLKGLN